MSEIKLHEPHHDDDFPDGAGMALAILGGLATLPLIVAAVMSGKPLWMVLAVWALGGPAVTVALGLVALRLHDCDAGKARVPHERKLSHV